MVAAAGYAREHGIPCLGLCLGLHVMVIAVARDLAGLERANSREFDCLSPHTVIDLMPDQAEVTEKGGTMRLGSYQAMLLPGSKVAEAYGTLGVTERHRHRFEFNNRYKARLEAVGLVCSGSSPDGRLVEFVELGGPSLLGGDPGPPRVQEPARPGPPPLPRAGGGGARAGRGTRAPPARPRRRHLRRRPVPGFRRVSEEELLRAWLFRVDRLAAARSRRGALRPRGGAPPRRGDRRPRPRRRHGDPRPPVPGRGRRAGARDARGHAGQGRRGARGDGAGASWPRRPGLEADALGAAHRDLELARRERPVHGHLPGHRPHAVPSPARRRRGGLHDRRAHPPGRRRRAGGRRLAQGRDDGARALPGPGPPGARG